MTSTRRPRNPLGLIPAYYPTQWVEIVAQRGVREAPERMGRMDDPAIYTNIHKWVDHAKGMFCHRIFKTCLEKWWQLFDPQGFSFQQPREDDRFGEEWEE